MQKPYKIGILQLSRLGDIVMMLPLTRALKRTYPGCHITMIVREKYKGALDLFDMVDDVVTLKTQDVLQPFLENESAVNETLNRLDAFISEVKSKNIDWLVNLSFSPASADLTYALLQGTESTFTGYNRFVDGYIRFSGTDAQYFFTEVGSRKENQIHLTEIFAKMTNTQLIEDDFACPAGEGQFLPEKSSRFYTVHLGASEEFKRPPVQRVAALMGLILDFDPEAAFCFLGTSEESEGTFQMISGLSEALKSRCINLTGKTSLRQLLGVMSMSHGHIGGDSLPVQLAMLSKTKVLLLSAEGTNFYETGPLSPQSIVWRQIDGEVDNENLVELVGCFLKNQQTLHTDDLFYPQNGLVKWTNHQMTNIFQSEALQQLSRYLYFDDEAPLIHDTTFTTGMNHLYEAHVLVLDHIQLALDRPEMLETLQAISKQVDAISEEISRYGHHLLKVCQWIALQKSQIAPQDMKAMLAASIPVYEKILAKANELRSLGVSMSYEKQKVNFEETP